MAGRRGVRQARRRSHRRLRQDHRPWTCPRSPSTPSLHKAPCGGEGTGPNPTDRAKIGWKWSVATDLLADPHRLGPRRSEPRRPPRERRRTAAAPPPPDPAVHVAAHPAQASPKGCPAGPKPYPRRREDPLPQTPYVLLDGPPTNGVPVQGFVLRSVHHAASGKRRRWLRCHGVQLALRFRPRCQCFNTGPPGPRQHPFGSGHSSRIRPVIPRAADGGADPHALRFPVAFRRPALASRVIPHRPGDWAFLTVGLPGTTSSPDPDGITTFHTRKIRPGWVPPVSRGRRYSPGR